MSNPKKFIKSSVRTFLRKNTLKKNNKIIKWKTKNLKDKNLLQQFPLDEITPKVQAYDFSHESDNYYYNFFYSVLGKPDDGIIPLSTYYIYLEPVLNDIGLLAAVKDKNFYDLFIPEAVTPKTYIRKLNGGFYDGQFKRIDILKTDINELVKNDTALILKPSILSGAGKSIQKFVKNGDTFISENQPLNNKLLMGYPDFVLQKSIDQHQFFRQFNPDSNNTIRILTYRSTKDESIKILHRLLRIGKKGSFLDHDNFGGIAIGVQKDGTLNDFGCDVMGIKYQTFNDIEFVNIDKVPFMKDLEEMSLHIANKIYYGRILALDFTVDQDGKSMLLEVNCWRNGISQYQMNLGSLFGEFTDEVLGYCADKDYEHIIKV